MDVAALNMMELKKTNTKIKPIKRSGLRIHHSNADCNLNLMEDSAKKAQPHSCIDHDGKRCPVAFCFQIAAEIL